MKAIKSLSILLLALMSFAGCEMMEGLQASGIKLDVEEIAFTSEAGSETFSFVPAGKWNMEYEDEWFEVSPESGAASADSVEVTVSVQENTGEAREAKLVIYVGTSWKSVKIIQEGAGLEDGGSEGNEDEGVVIPDGITLLTVSEFLSMEVDDTYYALTGTISNLTNTAYGDFDLVDETGTVYVYGLTATKVSKNDKSFESLGLREGDLVTLVGTRDQYKGQNQVGGPAYYISHKSNGNGDGRPDDGSGGTDGGSSNPNPDDPVTNPSQSIRADWLELPAMPDDSGLEYYFHKFNMNGKKYRNYSFGWSQDDYVALWVAYPLCSFYTQKNVGRSNDWDYDPLLGPGKSSAPFSGYGGSYSRGHQIASSDRLCCYEANAQTFYGTNMTPQSQDHNGGIWNQLEMQVRTWASGCDTVYVVTGCTVEGSKKKTEDSDGNVMTVPVSYWKALLRYDKDSSNNRWACAAFYTEHKAYSTSIKSLSISIDKLEEMTGFDFFANLPAKIGAEEAARLEAQDPKNATLWW